MKCPLRPGLIATDKETLAELFKEMTERIIENKKVLPSGEGRKTRRQAADFLGASYQTVGNWTKSGWLKEHGCGRKRYYLESELKEVTQKMHIRK